MVPGPGNKFDLECGKRSFDLECGKRSKSRSSHGTNKKDLTQGSCMPNINALSLILQKIWARLKFLWQRWMDRQTDGQMIFNVLSFRERLRTIINIYMYIYMSLWLTQWLKINEQYMTTTCTVKYMVMIGIIRNIKANKRRNRVKYSLL